jgi:hypothetical protein
MWYLILLFLSSVLGSANGCSEGRFLYGGAGGTKVEFMEPRGRLPEKVCEPVI